MTALEARDIADEYVRLKDIKNYDYDHIEEMHNIDSSMFNVSSKFPIGLRSKVWSVYYCSVGQMVFNEVAVSVTSGGDLIILIDDVTKICEELHTI